MTTQFQILNKILQTKDYSLVLLNNLTEDYFPGYPSEFKFIKSHYEKFGTVPDRLTFLDTFPDFDIKDVNEPDSYLIEQVSKEYTTQYIARHFNVLKKLIEEDKIDDAVAYLTDAANNVHQNTAMTCTDLLRDTSRYDKYVERVNSPDKFFYSTGFKELDDIIGGIDLKEENMVIAARTGIGKSWAILKIATACAKQGAIVGLYSGEMSADKVGYRVDTLLGHIDNKAITRGKYHDTTVDLAYKQYIDTLPSSVPGTIKVLTPNDINGPATVSALRAFVEKEKIDILLIDQYSLLEDQHHARVMHEKVANISKDIKNLQVMKQIPIISVSQMNRTKNDDGEQDTTQIGLSDRIGQDATCIVMLDREFTYQDPEKRVVATDKLILNLVKSRDGGSGKLVYDADFNTGRFTFLNPNLTAAQSEAMENYYEEDEGSYDPSIGTPW